MSDVLYACYQYLIINMNVSVNGEIFTFNLLQVMIAGALLSTIAVFLRGLISK